MRFDRMSLWMFIAHMIALMLLIMIILSFIVYISIEPLLR